MATFYLVELTGDEKHEKGSLVPGEIPYVSYDKDGQPDLRTYKSKDGVIETDNPWLLERLKTQPNVTSTKPKGTD